MKIPFNKPYLSGKELDYIADSIKSGKISGDGKYTEKVHQFFENVLGFNKCLMTTSCTAALEMAAILCNIEPGDEVIAPSFTFVSSVNAFVLRGAKIVFVDSMADHPNMDSSQIEPLITNKTKVIIAVHYAGVACDMDALLAIAQKYQLILVEDAAQAIDSYYKGIPCGSIGSVGAFSFHETKNIMAGEGGILVINDDSYFARAEIIREKGTNRSQFFRGEVDKYGWVDIGSSFLPSDLIAAYLYAQLETMQDIQSKRLEIWHRYDKGLSVLASAGILLPKIPNYASNNAHMYYFTCNTLDERTSLIQFLKNAGIHAIFHYQSLHKSAYYHIRHDGRNLPNSDIFTDQLIRLPLYYELTTDEQDYIIQNILDFYQC
jgi:dTDP-4-amino-4,6-dideoxygalactose transaminase